LFVNLFVVPEVNPRFSQSAKDSLWENRSKNCGGIDGHDRGRGKARAKYRGFSVAAAKAPPSVEMTCV
jgi:hypothetical protein